MYVSVKDWRGKPTLWIDDKPYPDINYVICGESCCQEPSQDDSQASLFAVCCPLGDRLCDHAVGLADGLWVGPQQLDLTGLYKRLTDYALTRPKSLIVLRVNLDVPSWWRALYPNELRLTPDGRRLNQSASSLVWRHEAGGELVRLIELMAQGPFERHIIAYQLCIGPSAHGAWTSAVDYSVPAQAGFRRWLHMRYGSDEALKAAWRRSDVTRATAELAGYEQICSSRGRASSDGPDEHVKDTLRYYTWSTVDAALWFSGLVKRASRGRLLTGFFVDRKELARWIWSERMIEQVLASADFDFVGVATGKRDRGNARHTCSRVENVVTRHGKLWFSASHG